MTEQRDNEIWNAAIAAAHELVAAAVLRVKGGFWGDISAADALVRCANNIPVLRKSDAICLELTARACESETFIAYRVTPLGKLEP